MRPRLPLVSVNIPCYRQLHHARRAVESILAQSFEDFDVTLFDDAASDEYREFVHALGDPRVRYRRNPDRLGAMHNMFAAITAGTGKYTVAFHEDDLLGRHYLEAAVSILERDPACGFVSGELRAFSVEPSPGELAHLWDGQAYQTCASGAEFLRAIFSGIEPMFGSNVYRRAALVDVSPAHSDFATLVDRPFLLSILNHWSAAIVRAPLVWYRHHESDGDVRHRTMTSAHVLRLFEAYRSALPPHLDARDRSLFGRYAGYWLFELYRLTSPSGRPALGRFLFQAWRRGLWRPSLRGPFGVKRIGRAVLRGRP